jgi:hypothetical protein
MQFDNSPEHSDKTLAARKPDLEETRIQSALTSDVDPILNTSSATKLDLRPVLSLNELSENRLADLSSLYKAKGYEFKSLDELVSQIRSDWKIHQEIEHTELSASNSLQDGVTEKLIPIVVDCAGHKVSIFGACHSWTSGREYHALFHRAITEYPSVLTEQGMGMFFRLPKERVMYADWSAIKIREYFTTGFMSGFDLRGPLSLVSGMLLPFQRREDERSTKRSWNLMNETAGLPDQIAREIQVSEGIPLDFIQRRSQYMAEFSRNWASLKKSDCAVFVGGSHATEVRDYLRYGVDDPRIQKLAADHARMAIENPLMYHAVYAYHSFKGLPVAIAGLAAGLTPWVSIAYGIRRLAFGF